MLGNPLLLGGDGYQISRSVRLRASATAYLSRTFAGTGNRKTWTWSAWVKRGALGSFQALFGSTANGSANDWTIFRFTNTDTLQLVDGASNSIVLATTAVFRDPSSWYHIVVTYDTTNATASLRQRIYVNNVLMTLTGTPLAQNADGNFNLVGVHNIVAQQAPPGAPGATLDGYLTDVNFIDGQALTPAAFGETDAVTGVWKPKRYTGTYGTNGFFLNFSDPSAATAAAIGRDYSGNGNNWTPNNISVTAGVTYDSMLDVPTPWADGGNGRGNYCVLNPLTNQSSATISGANLNVSGTVAHSASTTFAYPTSGKWYCEIQITSTPENALNELVGITTDVGVANNVVRAYASNGQYFNGSSWVAFGAAWSANDVIGIAADIDNSQLSFYRNGTLQGSAQSFTFGSTAAPMVRMRSSGTSTFNANFGQRPFAYTPPTGFKALNTQNLPEPTIKKGNQYFDASTYTGNGSTQSVVNAGSFQPDLVWAKRRSGSIQSHNLADSVRGVQKMLYSDLTFAESTDVNAITAFNSNGFSTGSSAGTNNNGDTYVAWQWREGATQGFDIVTYTGNGTSQNIAHTLGVAPRMMIVKQRTGVARNWFVYHGSLAATQCLEGLNTTSAASTQAAWNNTAPTSSVFSVGNNSGTNNSGDTYVAYLFSEVAGFSRFGSYTGNGSADGPFVFCGFRPAFVMVKRTDSTGSWFINDDARPGNNVNTFDLQANSSGAESSNSISDFTANGFKIRIDGLQVNASGGTFIFAAFAEVPFKVALAR